MAEKGLDADLCRLLSRAIGSPYWNYAQDTLQTGDQSPRDWLIEQGMEVYTFSKLPANLQEFLTLCDRSQELHWELFQGKPTGMEPDQEWRAVVGTMMQRGIIPYPPEEDDIPDDDYEDIEDEE